MSKHTPLPWNYRAGYVSTYVNGDYIVLAELHSKLGTDNFGSDEPLMLGPKERSANGHLMAAAPEMYELLEYIRDTATIETATDVLEQVNTLLAKIEGGGE